MKSRIAGLDDFAALDPFFRIVEQGLDGLAGPGHFFDLLAEDTVFEYVITVPGYPRRVEGATATSSTGGTPSTRSPSSTHSAGRLAELVKHRPVRSSRDFVYTAPSAVAG